MNIILLGAPGSGKGTQAKALMEAAGLTHVSSGDLFRDNIKSQTELGQLAQGYMNKGALVPDEVTIDMIRERLSQTDTRSGVLFDGFPRTVAQADALDVMLADLDQRIETAILLDVDEEDLVDRLSGRRICRECQTPFHVRFQPFSACPLGECDGEHLFQRDDDQPDTVRARLKVYGSQTAPVIDHYRAQDRLVVVDGTGAVDAITARMREVLEALQPG